MADALSCDNERMDNELTSILFCFAPHQMPSNFEITPLPNKIVSLADLAAVEATCQRAVQRSTHENQARAWQRWLDYCKSIGLYNTYLDGFDKHQKIKLMGAFATALREGRFSRDCGQLAKGTVQSSISYVVSTFWENGRANPTKDEDMELGWILHRLYRAFKNEDPKIAHQKAVLLSVISELWKSQNTEMELVVPVNT